MHHRVGGHAIKEGGYEVSASFGALSATDCAVRPADNRLKSDSMLFVIHALQRQHVQRHVRLPLCAGHRRLCDNSKVVYDVLLTLTSCGVNSSSRRPTRIQPTQAH